jgi:hypothetical protein
MSVSVLRRTLGRAAVILAAVATAVAGLSVLGPPAQAANRVTPRHFTGYGFDQCITQSQEVMDAWLHSSPYLAVGVYIAGDNRACGDALQTELTSEWIATQLRNGWRVLPITLGPQAPCYQNPKKKIRISNDPDKDYAKARQQGRIEARDTVARARALGITGGSTLWYDIEAFDTGNEVCRESTLHFLSAWTRTLHNKNYVSGVYASAARGMNALDDARIQRPRHYAMPDQIWVAEWVPADAYRRPPTDTPPSLYSSYLRNDGWLPGGRMRQYRGGHDETWGGVRINIDTNYLDLGRGTLPGRAGRTCMGHRVDFSSYRRLHFRSRGAQVKALQCLMKREGLYKRKLTYHYNKATVRAVRSYKRERDLGRNGATTTATWASLLSRGGSPVVKIGSGGAAVRRVQRTVNATTDAALVVDGIFGPDTTRAVRTYQRQVGLRPTGVVAPDTWLRMQAGDV